jgi:predicted permease
MGNVMRLSSKFLRFAAACALLSAVTTLVVHIVPALWAEANTFEKQLQLRSYPYYLVRLWVVMIHCVLVVISMYAIALLRFRDTPALAGLGFLSFIVFAFSEMLRTSLGIFALNRSWRAGFASAADEATRSWFHAAIEAYSGVNNALFFLFYVAFLLGILCYGLSLATTERLDRWVGWLFLLWTALNVPALIDSVTGIESISKWFDWVGPYFQPFARIVIGLWLWEKAKSAQPGFNPL